MKDLSPRTRMAGLLGGLMVTAATGMTMAAEKQPNIVLLMAEDISNDLACYGTPGLQTPNLDELARQGIRYTNCISTNPICSPNRSAMMVGAHQSMFNGQNHRSNRNTPLPKPYAPITHWLREAGYTCILGNESVMNEGKKTDVNFESSRLGPWDGETHFGLFDRIGNIDPNDQPFFAQIQFLVTHRGDWWNDISAQSDDPVRPEDVQLPPYIADHPVIRKDWARYLDQIEYMDREVGLVMDELREKGLADNTVVIFIGDNGRCNVKGKGYLYDSGLRVPLIVWWPEKLPGNQVLDDLVAVTDISASILDIAGAKLPDYLTGQPFIGRSTSRTEVISAKDRFDDVFDPTRSVTTNRFKYIRNDSPATPWDAHYAYLEFYRPALHIMRRLKVEGKLTPAQSAFFEAVRPHEELYDLSLDPYETQNLAGDPEHASVLEDLRNRLTEWESRLPQTGPGDIEYSPYATSDVFTYVRYLRPELYRRMLEGEEIGLQHLKVVYREYQESLKVKTGDN